MLKALRSLEYAEESETSIEALLEAHYKVRSTVRTAGEFSAYIKLLADLPSVWRESENRADRQEVVWNIGEEVSERIALSEISENQKSINWEELSEIIHESLLRE